MAMATSSGSATTGSSELILNADEPCETMDFLDIMKVIDISPTLLATCLELDESDRLSAEYRTRGDYKELIFEILKCWQSRNGKKATWRKLIESLQRLGNVQLVESIEDLQAEKRKQKQSWSHHEISMKRTHYCASNEQSDEPPEVLLSSSVECSTEDQISENTFKRPRLETEEQDDCNDSCIGPHDTLATPLQVNLVVRKNIKENEEKFAGLKSDVLRALELAVEKNEVSVGQVRTFLISLTCCEKANLQSFSSLISALQTAPTISGIFDTMTVHEAWDFLNYYLLERLAVKFLNRCQLTQQMQEYGAIVAKFRQETKLCDYVAFRSQKAALFPNRTTLKVKLNGNWSSYTLEDIHALQGFLASEFWLNRNIFKLQKAKVGSVVIYWLIPHSAAMLIQEKAQHKADILQAYGISLIEVDGSTVFMAKNEQGCQQHFQVEHGKDSTQYPNVNKLRPVPLYYSQLYKESMENPERFWGSLARQSLNWIRDFDHVMDCDMEEGRIAWFLGGKLNVTVNCLDRHAEARPNKVALIWEKDSPEQHEAITYRTLLEKTCQIANVLKRHGVTKGMNVVICMPTCLLAIMSMLACARIGAVHCVLYPGFSAQGLQNRIQASNAYAVITTNQTVIAGRETDFKYKIDQAVDECPTIGKVFVIKRTIANVVLREKDVLLEDAMMQESTTCDPEPMDSNDTLFIIYTSGTSGLPKPIIHAQAGYLIHAMITVENAFQFSRDDVFGCMTDLAWIAGHTCIVYGPLCIGGTTLVFESTLSYPDYGRYWEMVQRLKLTHLFTTPNNIKQLMKAGNTYVKAYDRSSLKMLISAGGPMQEEMWEWYSNVVGDSNCVVIDNWGQTESNGMLLAPWDVSTNTNGPRRFNPMSPFIGMDFAILEGEAGNPPMEILEPKTPGWLCIRKPIPGMARGVYGQCHEHFVESYFKQYPGYFFTGDIACLDEDGYCQVLGREGDIINHMGHKIGRVEIEGALCCDPRVSEAAVVGYPHDEFGEGIFAFVVLKNDEKDKTVLQASLKKTAENEIGTIAVPDVIEFVEALPETHSKKVIHRVLKIIAPFFATRRLQKHQEQAQPQDYGLMTSTPSSPVVIGPSPLWLPNVHSMMSPVLGDKPARSLHEKLLPMLTDAETLSNPLSVYKILSGFTK